MFSPVPVYEKQLPGLQDSIVFLKIQLKPDGKADKTVRSANGDEVWYIYSKLQMMIHIFLKGAPPWGNAKALPHGGVIIFGNQRFLSENHTKKLYIYLHSTRNPWANSQCHDESPV